MKGSGAGRVIDLLGRIVIPKSARTMLNIPPGTILDIRVEGDEIILRKQSHQCAICGDTADLLQFKDKYICSSCKQDIITK